MRLPHALTSRAAAACLAASLVTMPVHLPALAAPPSAAAQATLRRGMQAASDGLLTSADTLLSTSIDEWKRSAQPPDETSALLKMRANVRQSQGRLADARADLDDAVSLILSPSSKPDPAEIQRTYVLRARVNAQLQRWRDAEADLSAAIDRLDELDAIEANNPFLFSERSAARSRLGDFGGASEDSQRAAADFKAIGDKTRRLLAAADAALALYDGDDVKAATEQMRYVFANVRTAVSNNPDDIGLLQELSRKEAELHLAYAAHLYASGGSGGSGGNAADGKLQQPAAVVPEKVRVEAEKEWQGGCVRLEGFVADALERQREEALLRDEEQKRSEALGRDAAPMPSKGVAGAQFNNDFGLAARIAGLDPDSPYLTQRPQQGWFYYQTADGQKRRDGGVALATVDPTLSCGRFRAADWIKKERPEWPPKLVERAERYAAAVPQAPIVMPATKEAPPKDCVVLLGRKGIGDAVPCF